jgi:hypothetical protein
MIPYYWIYYKGYRLKVMGCGVEVWVKVEE